MGKNRLKKIAAMVLAAVMVTTVPAFADTGSGDDQNASFMEKYSAKASLPKPDNPVTDEVINGMLPAFNGTPDSGVSYTEITEIKSTDDLEDFIRSVNEGQLSYAGVTVNLCNDVVWPDGCSSVIKFNGTFNGNGKKISGLNGPFIQYLEKGGSINSLKISADISKDGNVGGIIGINDGTVNTCIFDGSIVSTSDPAGVTGCGGIAGINRGRIENCSTAEGSEIIRAGTYCGGIVGISLVTESSYAGSAKSSGVSAPYGIYNCSNYADITCKPSEGMTLAGAAAGIAGMHMVVAGTDNSGAFVEGLEPQIKGCTNYGDVTSGASAAAGIVAIADDTKITECINKGNIKQTNGLWSAGIVGSMNQENYYDADSGIDLENCLYVTNCVNKGNVTGITRNGGIVGGDEAYTTIGIKGKYQSCMYIKNCINTGDIETKGFGGGISGYACGDIIKSINTGRVYCDTTKSESNIDTYVGGIASIGTGNDIISCINIGEVRIDVNDPIKYSSACAGIAGLCSSGNVISSYSSAPVTGNHVSNLNENTTVYYGGIIGSGDTDYLQNSVFNGSFDDRAKRALASYIGSDSVKGLDFPEMVGTNLGASMDGIMSSNDFVTVPNMNISGKTYQFTPALKDMPALYEIDEETTLAHAAYVAADGSGGSDSDRSDNGATDTGDDSNPAPWIVLMAASLIGICTLLFRRQRM